MPSRITGLITADSYFCSPCTIIAKNFYFAPTIPTCVMNTTLEILKYTLPAVIVLIASYLIVQKFLVSEIKRKQLSLFNETQEITARLRLQAYERLVLFIERIQPRNLVPRTYQSGMTVTDLRAALIFNIKTEFEHNLSQQIYVSKEVWDTVRGVQEQEMGMINQIAQQLDPEAPAKELHKRIVDFVMTDDTAAPTDVALQIINEEAKRLLSFAAFGGS